jgi:hypothetical protein
MIQSPFQSGNPRRREFDAAAHPGPDAGDAHTAAGRFSEKRALHDSAPQSARQTFKIFERRRFRRRLSRYPCRRLFCVLRSRAAPGPVDFFSAAIPTATAAAAFPVAVNMASNTSVPLPSSIKNRALPLYGRAQRKAIHAWEPAGASSKRQPDRRVQVAPLEAGAGLEAVVMRNSTRLLRRQETPAPTRQRVRQGSTPYCLKPPPGVFTRGEVMDGRGLSAA